MTSNNTTNFVVNRARPTSISIIKFNARNTSVSTSPSRTYSGARLSYSTSAEPELHFISSICGQTNKDKPDDDEDDLNDASGNLFDTASEADEYAIADTGQHKPDVSFNDLPEEEPIEEVGTECGVVRDFDQHQQDSEFDDRNYVSPNQSTYNRVSQNISHFLQRVITLPFFHLRLFSIAFLMIAYFILPHFLTGLLTGFYISFVIFLFACVSDPNSYQRNTELGKEQEALNQIAQESDRLERKGKIYKGWMNILNEHYNPHSFHVNTIQTVLVRLDGNVLRISRPERMLLRHCFHIDPTLTETEPRMVSQNIYDLTGAKISLRPRRLARRRWFSRKYPICVKLAKVSGTNNHNSLGQRRSLRAKPAIDEEEKEQRKDGNEERKFSRTRKFSPESSEFTATSDEGEEDIDEAAIPMRHSVSAYTVMDKRCYQPTSFFPPSSLHHVGTVPHAANRRSDRYIFLFARSAREKERWFHKLRQASHRYQLLTNKDALVKTGGSTTSASSNARKRHVSEQAPLERLAERFSDEYCQYMLQQLQFSRQLESILAGLNADYEESVDGVVPMDLGRNKWKRTTDQPISNVFITLVNLIASRVFYDFCRDEHWCGAVRNKIQTKLSTIHLPYFIETLEISKLDLGTATPHILKVYAPSVDQWGIWCDFEVQYSGMIRLVLETRVNLMKLKSVGDSAESLKNGDGTLDSMPYSTSMLRMTPSRYSDDEIPESPETSPDEEFGSKLKESHNSASTTQNHANRPQKKGQKLLNLVDKIAHSKYFREASELRPIRKMMEDISSTRLMLNVEITTLEGTMTCNFPPPPSDRLWYAFRSPPLMSIKAIPQVGDRTVVLSTLSEWIESKLQLILDKNLVLPNMDDVIIPIMSGNLLLQGNLAR